MLRRFMAATIRTYDEGMQNAEASAAAMAEARPAANTVETLIRECRDMKPFTYTARSEKLGFGHTTKEDWEDTIAVVTKYFGGVEKSVSLADLFTADFLPKKAS
jgi:hypothetical protein